MDYLKQIGYLKGLMEGMDIAEDGVGKLLREIVNAIELLGDTLCENEQTVDSLATEMDDMTDQLDELSESLDDVEDALDSFADTIGRALHYDNDKIRVFDSNGYAGDNEDDEEDEDDEEYSYEIRCPSCGNVFTAGEDEVDGGVVKCTSCGETIEFEVEAPHND